MNKTESHMHQVGALGKGVQQALDWLGELGGKLAGAPGLRFDLSPWNGARAGAAAGADGLVFDLRQWTRAEPGEEEMQRAMFAYAASALGAKLMRADGPANESERRAFLRRFTVAGLSQERMKTILAAAAKDGAPFRQYARQIRALYAGNRAMREEIMTRLCGVALADGPLAREEFDFLRGVGDVLGFSREETAQLADGVDGPAEGAPHEILKIGRDASPDEAQRAYHERMRFCHPDRWGAKTEYKEMYRLAHEKSVAVNAAYVRFSKERRWN